MTRIYWENEASHTALAGEAIAVVGYGSQGRAHALNLRDSGLDVRVGLRPDGPSWKQAIEDGFAPRTVEDSVDGADLVAVLVPDMSQPKVYAEQVEPNLKAGATLLFGHGFNVHFKALEPRADNDVVMVAPKGPGNLVRDQYVAGRGVPCLVAVHQDPTGEAKTRALAYAAAIGGSRAGMIETTFGEETETDLFGEQAVLCGGVSELIKAGWETLVEAGYSPEVAYFECLHELKLIVDLIFEGGLARMYEFVSDTAGYGSVTRGPRVIDEGTRERMRQILREIREGAFAQEWRNDYEETPDRFAGLKAAEGSHPIEAVGRELRPRFSWTKAEPSAAP